nr:hypothetical protein [uncultured Niameybacter sp.]
MIYNEQLEEEYECFEGDLRRLDELISQLELWSDECTINHKREDAKLVEYVELNNNLEDLKEELNDFLAEHAQDEGKSESLKAYNNAIEEKIEKFKETQDHIHNWIREIKDIQIIVMRSETLKNNKEFIDEIINIENA